MNQATHRRISAQHAEDLRRLANQGERNGVSILFDRHHDQHVATSATNATACYAVDQDWGCSCRGYARWNRCQHFALLLSQLGLIPDTTEAETPVKLYVASCADVARIAAD